MNTAATPLLLPTPNFAQRLLATVRACVWSAPQETEAATPAAESPPRRVSAITAAGHESAGRFGRRADPANGVRVTPSTINPAANQPTCRARPGVAHVSSKPANRVTVIR